MALWLILVAFIASLLDEASAGQLIARDSGRGGFQERQRHQVGPQVQDHLLSLARVLAVRGGGGGTNLKPNQTEIIAARLDSALTGDEIFRIAEEIPAIRRSVDKAMRIVIADYADAVLAVHAIQRLAQLSANAVNGGWVPTDADRRFEQLTECIELRAAQLVVLDLARYLWGLSVLQIGDEDQVTIIFQEYARRLQPSSKHSGDAEKEAGGEDEDDEQDENDDGSANRKKLVTSIAGATAANNNINEREHSVDELATMLWTVGCVKNTYGWSNQSLVVDLATKLTLQPALEMLNIRLLARVLWTLAVHKIEDKVLVSYYISLISTRHVELAGSTLISVIWSCAKLGMLEEEHLYTLVLKLSSELTAGRIGLNEMALTAEALTEIYLGVSAKQRTLALKLARLESSAATTAPSEPLDHIVAALQQSVRDASKLTSMIESASSLFLSSSATHLPSLPMKTTVALVRCAVTVDACNPLVLENALRQVEAVVKANTTLSPADAASLLESISSMTWTNRRRPQQQQMQRQKELQERQQENEIDGMQQHSKDETVPYTTNVSPTKSGKTKRPKRSSISSSSSSSGGSSSSSSSSKSQKQSQKQSEVKSMQYGKGLTDFQTWQRLAGRISTFPSLSPKSIEFNESSLLLGAAWAEAKYCRPCSKINKCISAEVFRSLLPKLSPSALGRLATTIASDQKHSMQGSTSFDRRYLSELIPKVLRNAAEIFPIGEQVDAIVAVAELGPRIQYESSLISTAEKEEATPTHTNVSISISANELNQLRTRLLIKFMWAIGRLPEGLVSSATAAAVRQILMERNIQSGFDREGVGSVHLTDLMLLARLLVDARAAKQDHSFVEAIVRNVRKALSAHFPETSDDEEEAVKGGDSRGGGNDVPVLQKPDLVAICEVLQALIGLQHYNQELSELCRKVVEKELETSDDESSFACRRLYDLGRLEGLLGAFEKIKASNDGGLYGAQRFLQGLSSISSHLPSIGKWLNTQLITQNE